MPGLISGMHRRGRYESCAGMDLGERFHRLACVSLDGLAGADKGVRSRNGAPSHVVHLRNRFPRDKKIYDGEMYSQVA
jgi:hypothetical protein